MAPFSNEPFPSSKQPFSPDRASQGSIAQCRQVLEQHPNRLDAWCDYAIALRKGGQHAESLEAARRAVALSESLEPRRRVEVLRLLSLTQQAIGQFDASLATCQTMAGLLPSDHDTLYNLAMAWMRSGHRDQALLVFHSLLQLYPTSAQGLSQRGILLMQMGRWQEALACTSQAVSLHPTSVPTWNAHGVLSIQTGDHHGALHCFERALELDPHNADSHVNRALAWLMVGDYRQGWTEYEWRWKTGRMLADRFAQPAWQGLADPLVGRTLLLFDEQGLGDTLQFLRYIPLVQHLGAQIVLECHAPLVPLVQASFPNVTVVGRGQELPAHDLVAPLMSLPYHLGTVIETIPAAVPYLTVPAGQRQAWGERMTRLTGFRVGMAWQGSPSYPADKYRSIPAYHFRALASVPNVTWICLQKREGLAQLDQVRDALQLVDWTGEMDLQGAFTDTAAILSHLDLVITSDSALAHLAGALGVPTWLVLGKVPDWRWQLHGSTTPWYPSLRLFRQAELQDWGPVFQKLGQELTQHVMATAPSALAGREIQIPIGAGELFDKLTILELKRAHLTSTTSLANVGFELAALERVRDQAFLDTSLLTSPELTDAIARLRAVNEQLWRIEDALRLHEQRGDFGPSFVALARSVYHHNDQRAAIKREINRRCASRIVEEKQYGVR